MRARRRFNRFCEQTKAAITPGQLPAFYPRQTGPGLRMSRSSSPLGGKAPGQKGAETVVFGDQSFSQLVTVCLLDFVPAWMIFCLGRCT
jgi:hypothetical protein